LKYVLSYKIANYSTAGISITQAIPRRSCPVKFTSLLCVCARARACVCVCVCVSASGKIDGFFWKNTIELQIFESNVQNVHHYSVNIIEIYFQSFLILNISIILLQTLLFIMSNLMVSAFS